MGIFHYGSRTAIISLVNTIICHDRLLQKVAALLDSKCYSTS
jgi:hypothetical protein